jgi:predicted ferric reductase
MIILIFFTLYSRMKYNRWKFTHEFLGAVFVLAVLHIFLVRDSVAIDSIFPGYNFYALVVSFIGIASFIYSLIIKGRLTNRAIYTVSDVQKKDSIISITMSPKFKPISYKSGQFIFVRFYNQKLSREAHPFSIASKSNNPNINIIVKKLGDYTNDLDNLKVGNKVVIEGPYGRFNYEKHDDYEQIWIAGGIGITPFLGMVQDLDDKIRKKIYLFYTVKTESEFVGIELFNNFASKNKMFKFIPWVSDKQGFINLDKIKEIIGNTKGKKYFICGPPRLKEDIIINLKKQGVSHEDIYEEAFDLR